MDLHRCRSIALVGLVVVSAACSRTSSTPTIPPPSPTPIVAAGASPIAGAASGDVALPPFTPPPPTVRTGACTNGARFVEDVTVPDGSVFAPDEAFDKRWAVRNDGTCDWGPDYRLVPLGGNPFGGAAEIALFPAQAATIGEWQIDLRAPSEPGEYLGRWQARAPDGTLFGDEVFVVIIVELATPASSPSATAPR